jgi:hypothetical protein
VLRLVVDRIVVDDATLTVHHVVPTGPVRLQTGQASTAIDHTRASSSAHQRRSEPRRHRRRHAPEAG